MTNFACADEPDDVGLHVRPPESFGDELCRCVNTLVSDVVVSLCEDVEASIRPDDELVFAFGLSSEKLLVPDEKS